MNFKKKFSILLVKAKKRANAGAQITRNRSSKSRRLQIESLENRELLSAAAWLDATSDSQTSNDSVYEAASTVAPIPRLSIDDLLVADGQSPEKLTEKYVFGLSSRPTSNYTIYLDFNGHVNSGETQWHRLGYGKITTPAYSLDSNGSSFSNAELKSIYEIWLRVSEDFAPFDVNVTTVEPSTSALIKSGKNDNTYGVRVCIGGSSSDWLKKTAGGNSVLDSFTADSDTPAYVFSKEFSAAKNVAEEVSHEVGHTLGLGHDGYRNAPYYSGADGWAPIMGNGHSQPLTQWSKGEYVGATNKQDDLEIITTRNGFGYRSDDFGNTTAKAKTISVATSGVCANGIVEKNTDVDVFKFEYGGGKLALNVGGIESVTNLDALVKLYDASGKLLQTFDPSDSLSATVEITGRAVGTYCLSVEGTGLKKNGSVIYTDYASLGQYWIVATTSSTPLVAPSDFKLGIYDAATQRVPQSWKDNSNDEDGFLVQYSTDGGKTWNKSQTMGANATSRVATGVKNNLTYLFRVCAFRGKEYSDWAYAKAPSGVLEAPSDFKLGTYDAKTQSVPQSWKDNSNDEDGFLVQYSTDDGKTWNKSQTMSANVTSRVATAVKSNLTYLFRVCAVRGNEYSDWTYAKLTPGILEAPSDFKLGTFDAKKQSVPQSWKDNSSNEDGFLVQYSSDDGKTWRDSQKMGANVTSRVATGLKSNLTYQFRVRAFRGNEYSEWAYSEPIVIPGKIEAPSDVKLGSYDAMTQSVSLSWKDNSSNEKGFLVQYSSDGGKTWLLSEKMGTNATSRIAKGVKLNMKYQFRVRAFVGDAYSDWAYSEILNADVIAPSDLTLGTYDAQKQRVSLAWKDNSTYETGFRVEYTTNGGKTWNRAEITDANVTSRTATDVKQNATYQFRVCAVYGGAYSDWAYSKILDTSVKK